MFVSAEIVRAMTHAINQGMSMYWGTSRWSAMEIMVSDRKSPRLKKGSMIISTSSFVFLQHRDNNQCHHKNVYYLTVPLDIVITAEKDKKIR